MKALAEVVQSLGWKAVGTIYASDSYGQGVTFFQSEAKKLGIEVLASVSFFPNDGMLLASA
jgi:ABC-type branched-subunit amino acid transport system substrate-binding protein